MKRVIRLTVSCAILLLLSLPIQALAISFDGNVLLSEWFGCPAVELFREPSLCGITTATVRYEVQTAQSRVVFGFSATAPGITEEAPIGAVFLLGEREIARWQQGLGNGFDSGSYSLQGLACVQENSANDGYTFEIILGCKTESALAALEDLAVQLFDPQGALSRLVACPVAAAEPVTTTKAPTTERTTTTKAPTTEKTTTTKTPATEKPAATKTTTTAATTAAKAADTTVAATTVKPATTAKPAATQPVYTTAPPAAATAAQAEYGFAAMPQTTAAASAAPQEAQPGTSRTEVFYYSVVYTDEQSAPGMSNTERETLWTYAPQTPEPSQPMSLPTLAAPAPQTSREASANTPLLFSAAGGLALLAAGLFAVWIKARKTPIEAPAPEPPDYPP